MHFSERILPKYDARESKLMIYGKVIEVNNADQLGYFQEIEVDLKIILATKSSNAVCSLRL